MIVQCEKCHTKFMLDDERIPEGGGKGRCSKCQHIFLIEKPLGPNPLRPKSQTEGATEIPDDVRKISEELPVRRETMEKQEEKVSGQTLFGKHVKAVPRRIPSKWLVLSLMFVLLCGGAFLFQDKLPDINRLKGYFGLRVPDSDSVVFSKSQTRGYYIDNANIGRIFVIEGKAINNSSRVKSLIKIRGTLIDNAGHDIREKMVYCGNILSREELMELPADQINSRLGSPPVQSSTNLVVPPQESTLFMIVFFHLPEDMKEFSVESANAEKAVE